MDFKTLPSTPCTLRDVTVPACFLGREGDLIRTDIGLSDGQITAPGVAGDAGAGEDIQMAGAMVLPCFSDVHTHLDKGHIWPRASNPDGTFMGALTTVRADHMNWSAEDVAARMEFSLRCAYAHGTRVLRTHLDSPPEQFSISWPVFADIRDRWAGRVELQAASLAACDSYEDRQDFEVLADMVAQTGGVLGMVTYPVPDLRRRLMEFWEIAGNRGLDVDFHTDETMDASSETLRMIAETKLESGYDGAVMVGHCCSLSTQDEARAMDTLDLVAKAGLSVVSLPMCNLYLQDRAAGRTPRNRGVTLVHEMRARSIPVSFASDNTRDPFYAYGDLDMLEVLRQATRICHLDHSDPRWIESVITTPAHSCGFGVASLNAGAPADLVIFKARNWTELFSRPQSDRIVLRSGQAIDRTLPDYSELDNVVSKP